MTPDFYLAMSRIFPQYTAREQWSELSQGNGSFGKEEFLRARQGRPVAIPFFLRQCSAVVRLHLKEYTECVEDCTQRGLG